MNTKEKIITESISSRINKDNRLELTEVLLKGDKRYVNKYLSYEFKKHKYYK